MVWQQKLQELERAKQWDEAILFMQHVIVETPKLDAYLAMSYLLMNLLVEEDYDDNKHDYYEALSKKYFNDGYQKFYRDPGYLFFIGKIASISPWYVGIEDQQVRNMLNKAFELGSNDLYLWGSYGLLQGNDPYNRVLIDSCAERIKANPIFMHMLKSKGSLGRYMIEMLA